MKTVRIQTPEVVTYEVRLKYRNDPTLLTFNFETEAEALKFREGRHCAAIPPLWSEVYRVRTKKT